jgi:hypothetical protein
MGPIMKRRIVGSLARLLLVAAVFGMLLGTVSCDGSNVYVGVGVAGPYAGYPGGYGGMYGGGAYGGVYGRPFYP